MDQRVKLYVMGISYTPLQSGAYALILAQADGPYRIPMVIGSAEAQSIAINLERIVTPRPITHDIVCSFAHAFNIELVEVFIYKFDMGIFYSELLFYDGEREVRIEARASDAIAIALRTGSPIFTTEEIMHKTGTILKPGDVAEVTIADSDSTDTASYEAMSTEELEDTLAKLIADEDYEAAAKISEILKSRRDDMSDFI